ncbi:MAG: hypothetical protein R6U26_02725 [Candidatus Undinarchaeales archaeon]
MAVDTEEEGEKYIVKYGKGFLEKVDDEPNFGGTLHWLIVICGKDGPLGKIKNNYILKCFDVDAKDNAIWQYDRENRMYGGLNFFKKLKKKLEDKKKKFKNKVVYDQLLEFVDMFIQIYS